MERNEMINTLVRKANISEEEAQEVLEICNWDLLDAIIYLEKRGKIENNEVKAVTVFEVNGENQEKKESKKNHDEKFGGIGEILGRMFKFIGKFIKKGNKNFFEIRKSNEKPVRISLTISALILIFLTVPAIVLLLIGLLFGYKYSFSGKDFNYGGVNNIFEKASNSADNMKRDFKESYGK
ncbi:DUF4342 domain-containing protein [Clostridium sp. B9]|uniref:DUF4342 domain-containing protein n=1 Tax=Clostridium sp. B9 TaxID=3423224 RepID=UPI003D2F3DE4